MKQPDTDTAFGPHTATASRADDPEALAKHAIKLLEQHLRDAYGLKVQMGVELEYSLMLKPDAPTMADEPVASDPLQLGRNADQTLFKLSLFVNAGYLEAGYHKNEHGFAFQYEAVTDHAHPMPLHLLPNAIDKLRKEIVSGGDHMLNEDGTLYDPPETTKITKWNITHPRRIHQAKWFRDNVANVRFDSNPEGGIVNGLHLNFSLSTYTKNTESQKWEMGRPILKSGDALMTSLVDTTNRYFDEESVLFTHTSAQKFRTRTLRSVPKYPLVTIRSTDLEDKATPAPKGMPCYLENKAPPADCNPY